jgi:segregation and condensation protein A
MYTTAETYTIHLPQFEGPFDLLLFFIERDELDINDIPISKVTEDFLAYIRQMERLNVDLASEFVVVGATLCRIKAGMLLPRKPVDEAGNEIDPREELVNRLLEYKKFKEVLDTFRNWEDAREKKFERGNLEAELKILANQALADASLESVSLFKLLRTFESVMRKLEAKKPDTVYEIIPINYSMEDQQNILISLVKRKGRAAFADIFKHCVDRYQAIVTFLGLLELLNLEVFRFFSGEGLNSFWIESGKEVPY